MAPSQARPVDRDDLTRAVRAVAEHFGTEQVFVVGSQALLVGRPDIERTLRNSQEFDVYPANAKDWEATQPERIEASEEINALFGAGSDFHRTHGFYIDGVDERTATLAPDWRSRAVKLEVQLHDGRKVEAIAPEPNDLVAAKLVRGDPKDVAFASICLRSGLARHDAIASRLQVIMSEDTLKRALGLLRQAAKGQHAAGRGGTEIK